MIFLISPKIRIDKNVPDLFYLQVQKNKFVLFKKNEKVREIMSNELGKLNLVDAHMVKDLEVLTLWK